MKGQVLLEFSDLSRGYIGLTIDISLLLLCCPCITSHLKKKWDVSRPLAGGKACKVIPPWRGTQHHSYWDVPHLLTCSFLLPQVPVSPLQFRDCYMSTVCRFTVCWGPGVPSMYDLAPVSRNFGPGDKQNLVRQRENNARFPSSSSGGQIPAPHFRSSFCRSHHLDGSV